MNKATFLLGWSLAIVLFALAAGYAINVPTPTEAVMPVKSAADHATDGMNLMRAQQYDKAAVQFELAIHGGEAVEFALSQLAECYFYLGKDEDALHACDDLAARCPNAGRANLIRGLVYQRQGKKQEARLQFEEARRHRDRVASTFATGG